MQNEKTKPDTAGRLRLAVEVLRGKGEEALARYCAEGLPVPPAPKEARVKGCNLTPGGLLREYEDARRLFPREPGPSPRWREYSRAMNTWRGRVVLYLSREAGRKKR